MRPNPSVRRKDVTKIMKLKLPLLLAITLSIILITGWRPNVPLFGSRPDVETLRTSLMSAVKADNTEEAIRLIKMGADANCRTSANGWSALHFAVRNGNVEIVEALVQAGADPNYSGTMEGQTGNIVSEKPLEIAQAALDLANQVPPSNIEETLLRGGLNDPALVKSMKDPKAADRYQKVIEALTNVNNES
jgi:Ankyrin repeats (many copies)